MVTVIDGGEAVEGIVMVVEGTDLERKTKRPFIATLKATGSSFDRGNCISGVNQLEAFQNKVRAQVQKTEPAAAAWLIEAAQTVIDTYKAAGCGH